MSLPLLEAEETEELKEALAIYAPLKLVNACGIAGWVKDILATDPDKVIDAIRPSGKSQIDALKGMFEHIDKRYMTAPTFAKKHAEIKEHLAVGEKKQRSKVIVWAIVVSCVLSGQIYPIFLMKDDAYLHDSWQNGLALKLGFVSFAICVFIAWAFPRGIQWRVSKKPVEAKVFRQFCMIHCYDAIILERLPNMYGTLEQLLVLYRLLDHDRHVCHHWLAHTRCWRIRFWSCPRHLHSSHRKRFGGRVE